MTAPASHELTVSGYTLRRLSPTDAPGVVRLVEEVYGDSYYPRDLYDPAQIVRLNDAGRLVSVVALDAAGQVVGHYALERPRLAKVAEASDAIVLPQHRQHHLLEQMRVPLREEALRAGLTGIVGYPVTNIVFSQKAEEHFGAHPCGIALGLWPESFHNMPQPLAQRMSFAIYFKYLNPPEQVIHVATHHHQMIARIYGQYGIPIELRDPEPEEGAGEVSTEYEAPVQAGTIHVRRVGSDTAAAIRQARRDLCAAFDAKAVTLELPLAQAGTAAVCRAVEDEGFFFSGVGPAFADDGDALLLQYVSQEIDPALVQVDNAFAKGLLAYVLSEWKRVALAKVTESA